MNKYEVHISFVVCAETRPEAYGVVGNIIHRYMRGFASVEKVSQKPLPDPEKWIAINEPIKSRPAERVKVERIAETGEVIVSPLES